MVERGKIKINSKILIKELNHLYVRNPYKAKSGDTDDLVSATLLCVRIMGVLRDWDPKIYNSFTQIEDDEMSEKSCHCSCLFSINKINTVYGHTNSINSTF